MKASKTTHLRSLTQAWAKALMLLKNPHLTYEDLDDYDASRRQFLETTAKAIGVAALAPILGGLAGCEDKIKTNAKIAIVGGGIAGLNCAYTLKKMGVTTTIYEADSRVGGRMFSKLDVVGTNTVTEMGGEFLDSDHADMFALAKEFGLELLDVTLDKNVVKDTFFFNGRHYTEKEVVTEFNNHQMPNRILADLKACGEDYDTPYASALDKKSLQEYVDGFTCADWLKQLLIYSYVGEYGLDASEQSALNMVDLLSSETQENFELFGESDERYKIIGGNQRIPDEIAKRLEGQIVMNKKLIALNGNQKIGYDLVFNDGAIVQADIVVLAIPFTVLRKVSLDIGEMTDEKRKVIDELGYGMNNKLILGYSERTWRLGSPTAYAGYMYHKDVHTGWDNSHQQNQNAGAGAFTVFLGGTPALNMAQKAISKDTISEEGVQEFVNILDTVFKGTKAKFNQQHKVALWSKNPYSQGSYICYKKGQFTTLSGTERTTIGKIYFAGEHTSENFAGYMNGAAESGRVAAQAIAKEL